MKVGDVSPTWIGLKKSSGVIEKEFVFSTSQETISDSVSGLVMKESLAVVDIEVIEEETTVYNFEVEDDHTYFVTDAEVWVHNAPKSYSEVVDKFNNELGEGNRDQKSLLDSAMSRVRKNAGRLVNAKNLVEGVMGLVGLDEDIKVLEQEAIEGAHKTIDRKLKAELEALDGQIGSNELKLTEIRLKNNIPNFGNMDEQLAFVNSELEALDEKIALTSLLSNRGDSTSNEIVSMLQSKQKMLSDFVDTAKHNRDLHNYKVNAYEEAKNQHNQVNLLANDLKTNDLINDRILYQKQINQYSKGLPNNPVFKELESIQELKKATRAHYGSNFDVTPFSPVTGIAVDIIEDPTRAWKNYQETINNRSQPICSSYSIGSYKKCR